MRHAIVITTLLATGCGLLGSEVGQAATQTALELVSRVAEREFAKRGAQPDRINAVCFDVGDVSGAEDLPPGLVCYVPELAQ